MANETIAFEDVPPAHPARRHIAAVVQAGVIAPLSLNPPRFGPEYAVTRAQFAVYLCRAAGWEPLEVGTATFADVSELHWAHGFVETIHARGVLAGTADTPPRFLPDTALTRAAAAAALCRARGLEPLLRDQPTFADVPPEHWAFGWVERLVERESWGGVLISSGCDAGPPPRFGPEEVVTRAGLATLLCRAFGLLRE